jgi:hypothetical protein
VDENYVLYYNNSGTPTSIGTLEGDTHLLPFKGVCLLLDTSYIKYLDNLTTIKIAYDDGTGSSAYQYNNKDGDKDSIITLGNGTNSRVAVKFTSQAWDSGYTIPPTTITANLTRFGDGYTGTDNVDIMVRLRAVSDSSVLAEKILVSSPIETNLAATATEYEVTFSSTDITTEMSPSTAYYLSVEYDNGDGSHNVSVNVSDVSSAGVAFYYDGSWKADTTANPVMSLRPGRPPKASYGDIHIQRPFVAGDPDNPGYCWFGNLTYLDWSTTDGGGYVGSVDDNANNYPIGAVISQYNELYVFGKESQPFICKLTGSTPTDYALPSTFQRSWTTHVAIAKAPNDVWFANGSSLSNFSGVQEFGDVRTFPFADPVQDRFQSYWNSSGSLLEYVPDTRQLWLSFPSYHRVLVCHPSIPSYIQRKKRLPWSEYEFTRFLFTNPLTYKWTKSGSGTNEYYVELLAGGDPSIDTQPDVILLNGSKAEEGTVGSLYDHQWDYGDNDTLGYSTVYFRDDSGDPDSTEVDIRSCIIPTMLSYVNGNMLIGSSDGIVYKLDPTDYKDIEINHIRYDLRTAYMIVNVDAVLLERVEFDIGGKTGAQIDMSVYIDGKFLDYDFNNTYNLPIDDRLTIDDMMMDVQDAYFLVDQTNTLIQDWVNISLYRLQFRLHNILLAGNRIALNKIKGYISPLDF